MKGRTEYIFDKVAQDVACTFKDIGPMKDLFDSLDMHGKSILDIGCGLGDNLIYCLKKGATYAEGFDISLENVNIARSKCNGLSDIYFHKCSLEEYSSKVKFDIILALGVFEYLNNPVSALDKMVSLLKANGTIIIFVSRPIFIKRISFLIRPLLSNVPLRFILPVSQFLDKFFCLLHPILKKVLYTGESSTYSLKQAILEGLMVSRYNIVNHRIFCNHLASKGFKIKFIYNPTPSMVRFIAQR